MVTKISFSTRVSNFVRISKLMQIIQINRVTYQCGNVQFNILTIKNSSLTKTGKAEQQLAKVAIRYYVYTLEPAASFSIPLSGLVLCLSAYIRRTCVYFIHSVKDIWTHSLMPVSNAKIETITRQG